MTVRPIDGNELVRSLKNRRLHILMENENDGAAVFDDIVDWIKYTPTLTPPNEPLTIEQLREMRGKWVWIVSNDKDLTVTGWAYVGKDHVFTYWEYEIDALVGRVVYNLCDYGAWLAYAYPPAHIDREAWEKPCSMCGGKTTLYQHTNTTKLFMNTFGKAATLVTECMACPPYADCCMKGISANSAFKINFCPECGRPLTEKAWDELEKRLRG